MPIQTLDHINFVTADMKATRDFYCNVIGLVHGPKMPNASSGTEYFYIEGVKSPILHVGDASTPSKQENFNRLATANKKPGFSTGSVDHFCLTVDAEDYDSIVKRLNDHGITYETYHYKDISLTQVWALDPNGIRVELSFAM